jgi:hypothetical protein
MTYLIRFPPRNTAPTIVTELSERGLAREEVSLPTGDRYTTTRGKEGWEVEGHINYGQTIKGSDFKALVTHTIQAGHLESREVHGQISGKSDYHFYRRLDYIYSGDGSLERIRFSTSLYANASDWKKEPASWLRHAAGEIVMVREQGVLVRIETSEREGRRSLRGEPEYADPVVTVESLRRATNGAIDSLVSVAR